METAGKQNKWVNVLVNAQCCYEEIDELNQEFYN